VTDLRFAVTGAAPAEGGLEPQLVLALDVICADPAAQVRAMLLRCQVRIEAAARRYDAGESTRLGELFGEPARWSETLRSLLWANLQLHVPGFTGRTTLELSLPCGFDFSLAWVKYLDGVRSQALPLRLLFSGTIFSAQGASLEAAPIPWQSEAAFALPVEVCQAVRDGAFGGSVPLALRREIFDRLYEYRRRNGLPTWDLALDRLLARGEAP
jgi:hypothetical protein